MLGFRGGKETPVSPCLPYAGKINHNADKCTFLSNILTYDTFVWFVFHRALCQIQLRTANLLPRNKQFTIEVAVHLKLHCCPLDCFKFCLLCNVESVYSMYIRGFAIALTLDITHGQHVYVSCSISDFVIGKWYLIPFQF